ncbi:TetR/AcrR family transcriptional regulator [Amycolatopsis echigonensis]|uniref:TetR/AcrR family transcriptional regulator n=1 Tax=Amycolatopsis echigonensis TaxID=2576905 RepID=A0A8E2B432_9PSEU|nr:TetR/AcrR family transcriptional regulator [Amycolatopsis echigonensis]MBB2500535.1 TetR/AcrR family transcriptional regulator [Amycolatopsis echigonensis]
MTKTASTPARRPRGSITPDKVVAAAFAVSERDEALTFQAIGAELGAHPTAVYRHFRDKDELMRGLVDALLREQLDELGEPRENWQDELRAIAAALYDVFLRHPQIGQYAAARTARTEHEFRIVERLLAALRGGGFPKREAALCYRLFADACLSYAALDSAFASLSPETQAGDRAAWQQEYRSLSPAEFPQIAELAPDLPPVSERDTYLAFVDTVLFGLETRLARSTGTA